jgi:hypothetical protein
MATTQKANATRGAYRVCKGKFYVNDEKVAVNHRILKIGLLAAGLDADEACGPLSDEDARRILHMERSWLLAGLSAELRRSQPGRAA